MKVLGGKLLVRDLKDFLANSYMKDHKQQIGKFIYDPELSDQNVQVYYNDRQVVVIHRGTSSLKDWYANYKLFEDASYKNPRIKRSINVIDKVIEKYTNIPITSIGHSLAGLLAALSDKKVFEVLGVNSYVPKSKALTNVSDNEYLIRSSLDVASALSKTQKRKNVITIPAKTSNLLTEHSYNILDRLNGDTYVGRD